MKIKKGDQVLIISGKDRGKKGRVLRSLPEAGKIQVEGINLVKKHLKPKQQREKGEVISLPAPLNVSNAKLVCPKCGQPARVGYKLTEKKKYRICKKCHQEI